MVFEKEHLAGFGVDFEKVLELCRIKFQNPARASRISAQFFFGKHDFFFVVIGKPREFQSDVSRFFQRYEQRHFVFVKNVAVDCVDKVCPLRVFVVEHDAIIRIFRADVDKPCFGKFHSRCAAGVT